jgi:hypothetical protein
MTKVVARSGIEVSVEATRKPTPPSRVAETIALSHRENNDLDSTTLTPFQNRKPTMAHRIKIAYTSPVSAPRLAFPPGLPTPATPAPPAIQRMVPAATSGHYRLFRCANPETAVGGSAH